MIDAVVVGAGPAGLAVSRELARRGVGHAVLEAGPAPGDSWSKVYDSLRLHTGKHLSALPGKSLPRSAPLFVPAREYLDYLREYAAGFDLPIRTGARVSSVRRDGGGWRIESTGGDYAARSLVVATGIMSSPVVPSFPGRDLFGGTVRHSIRYLRPDPFVGRRVLVVGAGNSAGEIAPELAAAGAQVTVAIRSGANVVPLTVLGLPIQYVAWAALKLPVGPRRVVVSAFGRVTRLVRGAPPFPPSRKPLLGEVPIIGFRLVDAIRSGAVRLRGGVAAFTRTGVRFEDGSEDAFDDVILATGFRAALEPLGDLVTRDERGFAKRLDRVRSADQPDLYFVGHHYDGTGGLYNISRDAPAVAAMVAGGRARGLATGAGLG
jgi:cation diffusion facilitator CzcD-associated flavoprotein CzcO